MATKRQAVAAQSIQSALPNPTWMPSGTWVEPAWTTTSLIESLTRTVMAVQMTAAGVGEAQRGKTLAQKSDAPTSSQRKARNASADANKKAM